MDKSILIFADPFPPRTAVGAHRNVAICRHLAERNWRVTVITPRPRPDEPIDPRSLESIAPYIHIMKTAAPNLLGIATRIFRRRSREAESLTDDACATQPAGRAGRLAGLADWASWWLNVPDSKIGWFIPAVTAGLREAGRGGVAVVFSSGPVWTSHLAAAAVSYLLRTAFVADFRDPWHRSAFREIPYRSHRIADGLMEKFVVRRARFITCAWEGIRRHLVKRYPGKASDIVTILNGYDQQQMDSIEPVSIAEQRCVLLHVGTFYGPRSPVPLLEGLRILKADSPGQAGKLLVVLMGPETYDSVPLEELIRQYEVEDMVRAMPPVDHCRAISALKGCDVALLFGQSGDESLASVPAKVYEYIGAGKAVLAVGAGPEAVEIMRRGGCRLWSASAGQQIAAALKEIVSEHQRSRLGKPAEPAKRLAFTRQRMAEQLDGMLEAAIHARLTAGEF